MKKSAPSVKRFKVSAAASKPKMSKLARDIVAGFDEYAAHVRGEIKLRTRTYLIPSPVDIKALRKRLGMTQSEFSAKFAFNPRTLQDWEQGRAKPDTAVLAYLNIIDKRPKIIEEIGGFTS